MALLISGEGGARQSGASVMSEKQFVTIFDRQIQEIDQPPGHDETKEASKKATFCNRNCRLVSLVGVFCDEGVEGLDESDPSRGKVLLLKSLGRAGQLDESCGDVLHIFATCFDQR